MREGACGSQRPTISDDQGDPADLWGCGPLKGILANPTGLLHFGARSVWVYNAQMRCARSDGCQCSGSGNPPGASVLCTRGPMPPLFMSRM